MGLGNFTLVNGAKFNPFTFDELLKPSLMATEAHHQLEDAYGELAAQANLWEGVANELTDKETYAQLKRYSDDLRMQADVLAKQGLTPTSRRDMLNMKARYSSEITPVERAYNWRLQQIQSEAEGKAKGVVYNGDAASTSLDEYLKNPTLIHSAADSNAGLTRVGNVALALAKNLADAEITGKLDATTNKLLTSNGYKTKDVLKAIRQALIDLLGVINGTIPLNSNNPAAGIVMQLLRDEAVASGISLWNNANAVTEYMHKVMPALYNLVGTKQVTPVTNLLAVINALASASARAAQQSKKDALWDGIDAKLFLKGLKRKDGKIVDVATESKVYSPGDIAMLGSATAYGKANGLIPTGGTGGSGSSGSKVERAYNRLNTVYLDGKTRVLLDNKDINNVLSMYGNRPFDVSIRGGKVYFQEDGKDLYYYDKTKNQIITAPEEGEDGVVVTTDRIKDDNTFNRVKVEDLIKLGANISGNPGSENLYSYYIYPDNKLFGLIRDRSLLSIENKPNYVTKANDSNLLNLLLLQAAGMTPSNGTESITELTSQELAELYEYGDD